MCFSYLVTASVEFYRQEERIEDHVARLDVDWRLSLSDWAQVPSGVHQTPEGWHCNTKETPEVILVFLDSVSSEGLRFSLVFLCNSWPQGSRFHLFLLWQKQRLSPLYLQAANQFAGAENSHYHLEAWNHELQRCWVNYTDISSNRVYAN